MARLHGYGLHSGAEVSVELVAASGPLELERGGVARPLDAFRVTSTRRATDIACDAFSLATVEHLLAAFAGLGVRQGCRVVVDGASGELPLLDGGSRAWVDALEALSLPHTMAPLRVARRGRVDIGGSTFDFEPGEGTKVAVDVELPASCTGEVSWDGHPGSFARIASARTFATEADVAELASAGLARHVDPRSVLVVCADGIRSSTPGGASPDEPARHKLLDLIGDAFLHGGPPRGVLRAKRPGHARNHEAFHRALQLGYLVKDSA